MLKPVELSATTHLAHQAFLAEFPSNELFKALVIRFDGEYGRDSDGVANALYMEAMTNAYITFTHPWGLIFDLRALEYQCGSELGSVLSIGRRKFMYEHLPTAIVRSSSSSESIRSLLIERGISTRVLFNEVPEALRFVDRTHWTQALRSDRMDRLTGK
jgi:hypothetical protein